jgi:hypothetical protein
LVGGGHVAVKKAHILDEIKRTAAANRGVALGEARFEAETGIKRRDWYGIHWARWGDAIQEAGLAPNHLNTPFEEAKLFGSYARYAQELGHLPTAGELRLKRRADADFPSWNTFGRFGTKVELVKRVREHCRANADLASAEVLCDEYLRTADSSSEDAEPAADEVVIGFVYLIKSGRFYKIGKSNSAGRREYELSIQLPERAETVHVIRTDDPAGIETYWHKRFEASRKNGEWFELSGADVTAFKRRKFM